MTWPQYWRVGRMLGHDRVSERERGVPMIRIALVLATVLVFTGCATVLNDSTHPVRVDTVTEDGELVTGAKCRLHNDKYHDTFQSGDTIQVRRSARDLDITCRMDGHPDAVGRATSRANAGMWGNLLVGGAVGAIVDHSKGTAYTYPTWVRLVFGWVSTFDRRAEDTGAPLDGERVSRTAAVRMAPPSAAPAPNVSAAPPRAPSKDWMRWRD